MQIGFSVLALKESMRKTIVLIYSLSPADKIDLRVNGRSSRSGRAKTIDSMGSALDFTKACITPDPWLEKGATWPGSRET